MKANRLMNDDETAASLTGGARHDALHALRVLSEAAETGDEDATETPPLPDRLRDQWLETYGETAPAPAAPVRAAARENWLSRLTAFFTKPRLAWAGGFAAAAAIVLMMQQTGPEPSGPGGVTTRGDQGSVVTGTAARLIVVAPADKSGPLMQELVKAFPARNIARVDSAPASVEGDAIIVDTTAGSIRRAGKPDVKKISGDPLASPESVIMAVEGLDEPAPR